MVLTIKNMKEFTILQYTIKLKCTFENIISFEMFNLTKVNIGIGGQGKLHEAVQTYSTSCQFLKTLKSGAFHYNPSAS
jgi:hypothetical protein